MRKHKKYFLIGTTMAGLLLSPSAYSEITKCVKLDTFMTFADDTTSGNLLDLIATHTKMGWTVPVKAVALCSTSGASGVGGYVDTLQYSSAYSNNTHCFCRLISPAVSKWIYLGEITYDCARNACETRCQQILTDTAPSLLTPSQQTSIRNALLSNFLDY